MHIHDSFSLGVALSGVGYMYAVKIARSLLLKASASLMQLQVFRCGCVLCIARVAGVIQISYETNLVVITQQQPAATQAAASTVYGALTTHA
jgi:hypothetical protein